MHSSKFYIFTFGVIILLSVVSYSYKKLSQKNLCIQMYTKERGRVLANARKICYWEIDGLS